MNKFFLPYIRKQAGQPARILKKMPSTSQFMHAIGVKESGWGTPGVNVEDTFIRTKVIPERGSTAYGPWQMTIARLTDAKNNMSQDHPLYKEIVDFHDNVLVPQARNFTTYGNKGNLPPHLKRWDYGGKGYGMNPRQQKLLQVMAWTEMDRALKNSKGADPNTRLNNAVRSWTLGEKGARDASRKPPKGYYQHVIDTLYTHYPELF